jgi:hypothetical protein
LAAGWKHQLTTQINQHFLTPGETDTMSKEIAQQKDTALQPAAVATQPPVSAFSSIEAFESIQRMAQLLSSSQLIPKEYQKNVPNCVIAMEMANRIGTSPLPVMQSLIIVNGRPTWAAQWIIAAVNSTGKFSPLRFDISDEGPEEKVEYTYFVDRKPRKGAELIHNRTCRAWCIEKATGERLQSTEISIRMSVQEGWFSKPGSKWQTMPEQMLQYRAAAFFGRLYAPEVLLGMPTSDEARDVHDLNTVDSDGNVIEDVTTTQALNESLKTKKDKPAPSVEREHPAETEPEPELADNAKKPGREPDASLQALSRCRNDMSACVTIDDLDLAIDVGRESITNPVHKELAKEHYNLCVLKLEGKE